MTGQAVGAVQRHVDALLLDTEYITCLVRFGRARPGGTFSGLDCGENAAEANRHRGRGSRTDGDAAYDGTTGRVGVLPSGVSSQLPVVSGDRCDCGAEPDRNFSERRND